MDEKLIVFSLAIGSIGLYGVFLPPVSQVATTEQSPDEKRVLRETEGIGTAMLLAIGAVTASLTKSALPLVLALFLGVGMFAAYEYAMMRMVRDAA